MIGWGWERRPPYLAEGIKNIIKISEYFPLGHFCNVIHRLTGIIANPRVLVCEAGKDRRHNTREIIRQFLG